VRSLPSTTSSRMNEADSPERRRKRATASPSSAESGMSLERRKATRSPPSDANSNSHSDDRSMR
jgi:hypothetical protein